MLFYRLAISIAFPVLVAVFVLRVLRRREDREALRDRLMGLPETAGPSVWLHAASNGELASARPLIETLVQRGTAGIVVTTNTQTARDLGRSWGLEDVRFHLAPLDLRWLARRSLRRAKVRVLITLENELWPNRLIAAHESAVPVALIAARISDRSAQNWARRDRLARAALGPVALMSAQDHDSERRLQSLGVSEAATMPPLDLKALYLPIKIPEDAVADGFDRAKTVLFASTHPGEEEILLKALTLLRRSRPEVCAILAPRHPDRAAAIAALAVRLGIKAPRRSLGEVADGPLYIADTLGEMPLWYATSAVTFIAGTLTDRGGHTPFEPTAYGSAIVHGSDTRNFAATFAALDTGGGALLADTPEDIADAMMRALDRPGLAKIATSILRRETDLGPLLDRIGSLTTSP